ncbi:MAG: flagellar hook-basal body complex protein FliE [Anaeromyxobacter sp.]
MDGIRGIGGRDRPIEPGTGAAGGAGAARPATSFADTLGQAISRVDGLQLQADGEAQKVAMGEGNLHEVALALEKADVSLRVLTKVRNKIVEAYQEVMRMNV